MYSAAVGFYKQLRLEHGVVLGLMSIIQRPDVTYTWIYPTVNYSSGLVILNMAIKEQNILRMNIAIV